MENKRLQDMLDAMPQIAEAVNAFQSENIQHQVFRALFSALTGETVQTPDVGDEIDRGAAADGELSMPPAGANGQNDTSKTETSKPARTRKPSSAPAPTLGTLC